MAPPVVPAVPVLHRGAGWAAVDKPPGFPIAAERQKPGETPLLDAIAAALGAERLLVVHRLDRDTTGVLLVATEPEAHRDLSIQFQRREVRKEYLAIVRGDVIVAEGHVDARLEKDPSRPGHMRVARPGRPAKRAFTRYEVVERFRGYSLLRVRPRTGRMHQIRVHLAHAGFPLAVDPDYGGGEALLLSTLKRGYKPPRDRPEAPLLGRLALHAAALTLRDPATGSTIRIEAPLPDDLERALRALRKYAAGPAIRRDGARAPDLAE